ncbi:MAG: DUF6814 family protein [Saprospiraceae bacterium]
MMNTIKRFSGLVWMALGITAIALLLRQAGIEIAEAKAGLRPLLDTRMFWYVIVPIFAPIQFGLCLFGWFALKGEFSSNK